MNDTLSVLTHFIPLASFHTPRKRQKTRSFFMFSGGTERDQWHDIVIIINNKGGGLDGVEKIVQAVS